MKWHPVNTSSATHAAGLSITYAVAGQTNARNAERSSEPNINNNIKRTGTKLIISSGTVF